MNYLLLVFSFLLTACGSNNLNINSLTPVGTPDGDGVVVKSRASFTISTGDQPQISYFKQLFNFFVPSALASNAAQTLPVTVINTATSSMSLDNAGFTLPTISNSLLDFGHVQIKQLLDNDIKVCGTNGKQKCSTAIIRVYTTGTAGAGLYNSIDGYGVPILAGQSSLLTVGLNASGAATLQTFTIPNNRNTVQLSDFPNPKYNVKSDFSDAGVGSYSTTIVIEYALM